MRIVIVGGGSAGWMTAAYLQTVFSDLHEITLIESSNIPTIGVGEATFSTLKLFFDRLGLPESEWMPPCNGTYKLAIRFVNWTDRPGHFYHPFQRYDVVDGFNLGEWWLKLLRDEMQFDSACFTITELCENKKSPRFFDGTVFDDKVKDYFGEGKPPNNEIAQHTVQYPYGYHFDASLLAMFLKTLSMKRGVRQITDDVTDVKLREDGSIVHLVTKEHGNIEADLYIDCTGFRGLLINQALNEPFISFSDNLPNDRAVAIQVPTDPPKEGLAPYTMATALSAGWAWTIPLYNRNGCGYVYSGKYIDKDQAEAELRRFLGPRSDNSRAHHVQMRVGRCRNSWVQNCIAVGLSSGFVEPLESTGLFFIQYAIEEIVNHLPVEPRACENERLSYNRAINDSIDGIREFLIVHYRASDRTDTQYWRDTKTLKLTDALEERMKIWKARLPAPRNIFQPYHGFEAYSYSCILLGMNYEPEAYHPVLDVREEAKARAMFRTIREKSTRLVQSLPSQYEYLKHMRNGASTSASAIASLRRDLAREHSAV
jgi:tryptophan halogenase